MRQRITVENLKELSPEQQEKLMVWWLAQEENEGDWYYNSRLRIKTKIVFYCESDHYLSQIPDEHCLPLLSIGQCIGLLDKDIDVINFMPKGYIIECHPRFESKELIDALWQAVKELL